MNKVILAVLPLLLLAGCGPEQKDYTASAKCQDLGLKPGTSEYDKCYAEQKNIHLMEEQRKEFDQMKQQDMDWNMRQY